MTIEFELVNHLDEDGLLVYRALARVKLAPEVAREANCGLVRTPLRFHAVKETK